MSVDEIPTRPGHHALTAEPGRELMAIAFTVMKGIIARIMLDRPEQAIMPLPNARAIAP